MNAETIKTLRLRALALITVAGTAWISFSSSQDLAVRAGFGVRSWAFPICLDAVAAFATDIWMRRSPAQRPAATLALFAIGLSLASNVADHYLVAGTALAALLGGIPPAMLAWLLLVLHKHGAPARTSSIESHVAQEAPAPAPVQPVIEPLHFERDVPEPSRPTTQFEDAAPEDPPQVAVMAGQRVEPINHYPAPELVKPLPTNVPDNDPERTQIMPRITDEEPGKFDPNGADPAPAKVQPARRAAEVTTPVSKAHLSNEDLINLALAEGLTSRRAIVAAFRIGTGRAANIARAIKEKTGE